MSAAAVLSIVVFLALMFLKVPVFVSVMAGTCSYLAMTPAMKKAGSRHSTTCSRAYHFARSRVASTAVMNGVDAICFTAGVGENSPLVRNLACERLGYLGIALDKEKNDKRGEELEVSTPDSKVKVMVIPTNEELAIARETFALVK